MLLLFNNVDKVIFMRPLTGLWALYNFASGFISNVLSYLRLFALGLAGGLLGGAVNQIAFLFITNQETGEVTYGSVWIAGTILVLIGGHIVNLGFSALAAFIHPLRLTFVEFYSAVGFKGGSRPYVPFANVKQQ
jgi:V/A-type H+-transporting ATPase subunit I